MTYCTITGIWNEADNTPLADHTITAVPVFGVVSDGAGKAVVPQVKEFTTNGSGSASVVLLSGEYIFQFTPLVKGEAKGFRGFVPNQASATPGDVFDVSASVALIDINQAVADAEAAAAAALVSETAAASSASAALVSAAAAEASKVSAQTAQTQAELAATAAGAKLYDSVANGLAGTVDGDVFFVSTEPGVQVYRNDTGSGTFLGWLGEVLFDDVAALLADTGSFSEGTIIQTRTEGFAYQVAASAATDHDVTTAGSVKLYVLHKNAGICVTAFGAVGDGVADDTAAIQNAVNASSIVRFPSGSYRLTSSTYDASADWRHHIVIPANRTLIFEQQAKIVATTPFASRAVALLVRGSNVTIDGAQIEDDFGPGSPFLLGVGSGSSYDSSYPVGTLNNLRVLNSTFRNCWISVSVQFASTDGGSKFFEDIHVINCSAYAKSGNTSSGNFNFRSDGPWKVKDVKVTSCTAHDGYSASSFNFYGVDGFSVSNCASYRNKYAGCEMENGTQDGVVSCFRSVDDFWGVWIDDSRRIVVDGVSHKTLSESMTGLLGTQSRLRDALKVTRQGFTGYTTWETTDIVFSNVVSEFGKISTEAFGASPAGSMGRLSFSNISIIQDGVSRASGNNAVSILSAPSHLTLSNVKVFGAPAASFNIGTTGGKVHLSNITTGTVAGESSTGIQASGTGTLVLENIDAHSDSISVSPVPTRLNYSIGGVLQPDVRDSQRFFFDVTGSPEGALSAGPGSLAHRSDVGSIYVKGSGIGNTGWLLVTAT